MTQEQPEGAPYFAPRLKWFEVRGDEVQPGDHVQVYRHQALRTVWTMWCSRLPGIKAWDRHSIFFQEREFPYAVCALTPGLRYSIVRPGVYIEGWSPEECAAKRAVWEMEQRFASDDDSAQDDRGAAARVEGGRPGVGVRRAGSVRLPGAYAEVADGAAGAEPVRRDREDRVAARAAR